VLSTVVRLEIGVLGIVQMHTTLALAEVTGIVVASHVEAQGGLVVEPLATKLTVWVAFATILVATAEVGLIVGLCVDLLLRGERLLEFHTQEAHLVVVLGAVVGAESFHVALYGTAYAALACPQ